MFNIIWQENGYDYDLRDGTVTTGDDLKSMVIYCLFTDARAGDDDALPPETSDQRGWPGDTYSDFNWGSRLWLLQREKLTAETVNRVRDYAKEALKPLVSYRYAKSYQVTTRRAGRDTVTMEITITKPDNRQISYRANLIWEAFTHV
jgi:phage gp46-like protein